jgi:flavorubredoxin
MQPDSAHLTQPQAPDVMPHLVAPDTYLIPNLYQAGPDTFLPVNSMVMLGKEPIVVDTGAPIHTESWFRQVFSLVDPEDIRWIYLSHDDGDHTGSLHRLLELAPNATLVVNFFITERLALEQALPLDRMIWLGPDDHLDAGDRRLHLMVPPIFDGPTTRALYDESTSVLWAVDSFAALAPGAVFDVADVPRDLYDETFAQLNSLISPWHQWLDPVKYARHVNRVEGLRPHAVASAHGPVLKGTAITDAFARVRAMAGQPIVQPPGQALLDELVAAVVAAAN